MRMPIIDEVPLERRCSSSRGARGNDVADWAFGVLFTVSQGYARAEAGRPLQPGSLGPRTAQEELYRTPCEAANVKNAMNAMMPITNSASPT